MNTRVLTVKSHINPDKCMIIFAVAILNSQANVQNTDCQVIILLLAVTSNCKFKDFFPQCPPFHLYQ